MQHCERVNSLANKMLLDRFGLANKYYAMGKVLEASKMQIVISMPNAKLNDFVRIKLKSNEEVYGKIILVKNKHAVVKCEGNYTGLRTGVEVQNCLMPRNEISPKYLGCNLDGFGNPKERFAESSKLLSRLPGVFPFRNFHRKIQPKKTTKLEVFLTKVSVVDACTTLAKGQSLAIVAPPGVGKSFLVNQIVDKSKVDINIVVLVGERGREIEEFLVEIEKSKKSSQTIVISTPSNARQNERAHSVATGYEFAEYFRDCGYDVLLVVDSLTRLARTWREQAISSGEIPTRQGYPSSVFERLPKYLERGGNYKVGSITSIFTLLARDEFINDPLIEETIGVVDGHIFLSSKLAQSGQFPALDIQKSLSRLQTKLLDESQQQTISKTRELYCSYVEDEEIIKLTSSENTDNARRAAEYENLMLFLRTPLHYENISELISALDRTIAQEAN